MLKRIISRYARYCFCVVLALWSMGCGSYEIIPSASHLPSSAQVEAERAALAVPPDLLKKLNAVLAEARKTAENERPDPRYLAQSASRLKSVEDRLIFTLLEWGVDKYVEAKHPPEPAPNEPVLREWPLPPETRERTRSSRHRSAHAAAVGMEEIIMSKQFIHAQEDIANLVRFADSIGLLLLPVRLGTENDTRPRTPDELQSFSWGTLLFFRPEWVMDELIVDPGVGVFEGTYSVRGGVNMANLYFSFGRDKDLAGVRQFGCGAANFEREWLDSKAHEVRLSPPEVAQTYKVMCKELFSKVSVRGGVHNYHVCKQAAELAARIETRPPFDYIPWPPPDLNKKIGK